MGYVAAGLEVGGGRTFTAPGTRVATKPAPTCPAGTHWVPPSGSRAGYCARGESSRGTVATVTETPRSEAAKACAKMGKDWGACVRFIEEGGTIADFNHYRVCRGRGYTGQSLAVCVDGRKNGIPFAEIDKVIEELAQQATAAEQAAIAQEQALVASRKRRTIFIIGGLAAAGVAGFLYYKKRKARRTK